MAIADHRSTSIRDPAMIEVCKYYHSCTLHHTLGPMQDRASLSDPSDVASINLKSFLKFDFEPRSASSAALAWPRSCFLATRCGVSLATRCRIPFCRSSPCCCSVGWHNVCLCAASRSCGRATHHAQPTFSCQQVTCVVPLKNSKRLPGALLSSVRLCPSRPRPGPHRVAGRLGAFSRSRSGPPSARWRIMRRLEAYHQGDALSFYVSITCSMGQKGGEAVWTCPRGI